MLANKSSATFANGAVKRQVYKVEQVVNNEACIILRRVSTQYRYRPTPIAYLLMVSILIMYRISHGSTYGTGRWVMNEKHLSLGQMRRISCATSVAASPIRLATGPGQTKPPRLT